MTPKTAAGLISDQNEACETSETSGCETSASLTLTSSSSSSPPSLHVLV